MADDLDRIHAREANSRDAAGLVDLWANSPEKVGDWDIVVERAPDPFAQFRLQERVGISILEEDGRILASIVMAQLNTSVAGEELSVRCVQGMRVHRDARGRGLSRLIQLSALPPLMPFFLGHFFYLRAENSGARDWLDRQYDNFRNRRQAFTAEVPGLPVEVLQYPAEPGAGDDRGIRAATRGDLAACAALINATHAGQDLFRPYTPEYLAGRLQGWAAGPRPRGLWLPYTIDDFHVVEDAGRIVACAGLWDRGRDMREVWTHRDTGERRTVHRTAILDIGVEPGHEEALARLIVRFIAATHAAGRDLLMAPLQQLPKVAALLEDRNPAPEVRGLSWTILQQRGELSEQYAHLQVSNPHTDLAYW